MLPELYSKGIPVFGIGANSGGYNTKDEEDNLPPLPAKQTKKRDVSPGVLGSVA